VQGVLERCLSLEKKAFAKHEAMDLAAETRRRGSLLLVALASPQWPDLGALGQAAGSYIYIYIYMYHVYTYIYMYVFMYIYIYISVPQRLVL